MKFNSDFRESNPALHKLYVGWALDALEIANEAIDQFDDMSLITSYFMAASLREEIRKNAFSDAAWFEAVALNAMGISQVSEIEELTNATN